MTKANKAKDETKVPPECSTALGQIQAHKSLLANYSQHTKSVVWSVSEHVPLQFAATSMSSVPLDI